MPRPTLAGCDGWGLLGGQKFIENWPFFITYQILRSFMISSFFKVSSASAWPSIRAGTRDASSPWLLVLPGCDIPFWKALDKPNKCEIAVF